MKLIARLLIGVFILYAQQALAATGCNYPTTLDSYSDKVTGDFLTTADINSRSCAIEQLELRVSQFGTGRSGGQVIVGGTGASQTLQFRSTANATKGAIVLGTLSAYDENTDRLGIGTTIPTHKLTVINAAGGSIGRYTSTSAGSTGPAVEYFHDTTSPAANDIVGALTIFGRTTTAATPITHQISFIYDDPTNASMDTSISFLVANNVNAGSAATTARLTSLGVWTDASSAAIKDYEGDISALDKLKQLTTIGVYRGKGLPAEKIANAERHYSPTAEDFYRVFGFGNDTTIAPKDAAWIAAKAVLELEARVQALEKVAP